VAEKTGDEVVVSGTGDGAPEGATGSTSSSTSEGVELVKDLRLRDATLIGVGAMIGAGIFVLTGFAMSIAGPALMLAFILNGIVALMTAMCYAELGACYPEAGGGYLWVKEALSDRMGFLTGWMSWFAHCVACTLYSLGFGFYLAFLLHENGVDLLVEPDTAAIILGGSITLLFLGVNFMGTSEMGKAENIITVVKVIIIAFFILFGVVASFQQPDLWSRFMPFINEHALHGAAGGGQKEGYLGILLAMGLTFIAFEGYEIIAQAGEELEDPGTNIPKATFYSLGIVVPIYVLVAFVAIGAVNPPADFQGSSWEYLGDDPERAMVNAAGTFMPAGVVIMLAAGLLSTLSALNATIFSSSRVSFAMGRDGSLPARLGEIHPKRRTPHIAIAASGFLIIGMMLFPIERVAAATDMMFILMFILVNIALVRLRDIRPDLPRTYRVPFVPYLQYISVACLLLITAVLIYETGWYTLVTLVWIGAGMVLYSKVHTEHVEPRPVAPAVKSASTSGYIVGVSVVNPATAPYLLTAAARLAKARNGSVVSMSFVRIPKTTPLASARALFQDIVSARHELLERAMDGVDLGGVHVHNRVFLCHDIPRSLAQTARKERLDLLLMGWKGKIRTRANRLSLTQAVLETVPCDMAVLKFADRDMKRPPSSILGKTVVAFGRGPHSDLGLTMARDMGTSMEVLRIPRQDEMDRADGEGPDDKGTVREALLEQMRVEVTRRLTGVDPDGEGEAPVGPDGEVSIDHSLAGSSAVVNELVRASQNGDLLVIGASNEWILRKVLFGSIPDEVANTSTSSVMLVKHHESLPTTHIRLLAKRLMRWF